MSETNLVADWQSRAAAVGLTLSDLCRTAEIDRSTIERWKIMPPKSIIAFKKIEHALISAEKVKNKDDKAEFDLHEYNQREDVF